MATDFTSNGPITLSNSVTISTADQVPLTIADCTCDEPQICPVHSKLCDICKHYIPTNECYHSNAEHTIFYHEVCSYRQQIEKLTQENAELRAKIPT